MQEFDNIWSMVLKELSKTYPAASMSIWFNDLTMISLTSETCTLQVEPGFKKDILEKRYKKDVEKCMEAVIGYPITAIFKDSVPTVTIYREPDANEVRINQENEIRLTDTEGDLPYYSTGGSNMVSKVINQVGNHKTEYTFEDTHSPK